MKNFWHNSITEKSFSALQELRRDFDFTLIGGWAVYLYTKALKSKDIDFVCDFGTLGKLREKFDLVKNQRLRKYEIKADGFDIDIYVPYYSELGLPLEDVLLNYEIIDGFKVPKKEFLLAMKIFTYRQRKGNIKGEKDKIDILSILNFTDIDWRIMGNIIKKYNLLFAREEILEIMKSINEIKELGLNVKQTAILKKRIVKTLKSNL